MSTPLMRRVSKALGLCDHKYVIVKEAPLELVDKNTERLLALIYIKSCEHCGRMRKWRFTIR